MATRMMLKVSNRGRFAPRLKTSLGAMPIIDARQRWRVATRSQGAGSTQAYN
jgi:hypothetical protein